MLMIRLLLPLLYICFGMKNVNKTDGNFFEQFFEANLLDKGLTKIAHEGGRAHGLLNVTPSDCFFFENHYPKQKRTNRHRQSVADSR